MTVIFELVLIGICIAVQALFAMIEIALLSCDRITIRHLAQKNNFRARWVDRFLSRPVDYLATTMIGVNVSVVIGASFASHLAGRFFHESVAPFIATGCLWPLILLFGEFIPMSIALAFPLQISLWGILGLRTIYTLFKPFVRLTAFLSDKINLLLGNKDAMTNSYFTRDELRLVFKGVGKDFFDSGEDRMVRRVFDFHKVRVREIMVPLKDVVCAPVEATVQKVKKVIFDSEFSRIPIYQVSPRYIVGTVRAMDLMGLDDDLPIEKYMRAPLKVSQADTAAEVLRLLRSNQRYLAVVRDERDRCVGIITMEDILEEIVGEIEDEYDVNKERPE